MFYLRSFTLTHKPISFFIYKRNRLFVLLKKYFSSGEHSQCTDCGFITKKGGDGVFKNPKYRPPAEKYTYVTNILELQKLSFREAAVILVRR